MKIDLASSSCSPASCSRPRRSPASRSRTSAARPPRAARRSPSRGTGRSRPSPTGRDSLHGRHPGATGEGRAGAERHAAPSVDAALKIAGVDADEHPDEPGLARPALRRPAAQTILGYAASTTRHRRRRARESRRAVDAAVAAGANGVSGPSSRAPTSDALYRDALKHAVADAKAKAQALADAAGLTLGGVQSIVEGARLRPDRRSRGRRRGAGVRSSPARRRSTRPSPSPTRPASRAPLDGQPALRPLAPRAGIEPSRRGRRARRGAGRRRR